MFSCLHGTKGPSSSWHSNVAAWLASIVAVTTVPDTLTVKPTGTLVSGPSVASRLWPFEVPLTLTKWVLGRTEVNSDLSEPKTKSVDEWLYFSLLQ